MIEELAKIVDTAAHHVQPIPQLSLTKAFSVADAYAIQAASIGRRYERGEQFVGVKMGFTSKAKMEQMGVHDMIYGRLTDGMLLQQGATVPFSKFIHPRAEPELCFLVKQQIDRPITLEEIPDFIESVAAAIEIIDSRYQNFKFSLEDVIADNCSSAGLVVGDWQPIDQPIDDLKIDLRINGEIVQQGTSAAILGNPWESVIAAARLSATYGQVLPAGSLIMAGAATSAVYLQAGQQVEAVVERLGRVGFKMG